MNPHDPSLPSPAVEGGFARVARTSDVPEGTLLSVQHGRKRICLFNQGGQIGAVTDLCTHQAFPMSAGTLERDGTIECAWHGARFDCRTGDVLQGPAVEPLTIYQVRIEGDEILVGPPQ